MNRKWPRMHGQGVERAGQAIEVAREAGKDEGSREETRSHGRRSARAKIAREAR